MIKTLDQLKTGESGKLVSYNEDGDTELKRHLMGMGFVRGSEITLEKIAPLGDPYEYKVKGYSVCLRKEEAKNIEVEIVE
ncbi:FeoA family protein [Methanobrevibacter sp. AbM4]|uniref:FeoA family protein n=1 Tax=Methanobrevibacter sp. AbM4 TaxID=224719 RepID=UPI0003348BC4|nr:FeoA family protein [Methanobrevibacter sp. AbM4]AGN16555.1 ferrous iron transport protein A FeoA [Methanobrevibacter sp. AbM4]